MKEAILFWLAKPLAELSIGIGVTALVTVALLLMNLPSIMRKAKCGHEEGVSETSACDAICRKCGKNLGFIGSWRSAQPGDEGEKK